MSTTPETEPGPQRPPAPTWRELIYGNVRVLLGVAVFAVVAFAIWRVAAWLFPEIGWLQLGDDR